MPSLPQKMRRAIARSLQQALSQYQQAMSSGIEFHNNREFTNACQQFYHALSVAQHLIDREPLRGSQRFLTLKISASHNLSASYSALGQLANACDVLEELHRNLLKLCLAPAVSRDLRITALGALDNSLFSFASNLGRQGKVDRLYQVISETDRVAELAAAQLLH